MPKKKSSGASVCDSIMDALQEDSASLAANGRDRLVNEIAEGRAIVYVGAGVSQSADLQSWNGLLGQLQTEASGRLHKEGDIAKAYFDGLRGKSRNLEVGDWLRNLLKPDFQQIVSRKISERERLSQSKPSTIHRNLVRLPFSMAITTNYDLLLEDAYDLLRQTAYEAGHPKLPPLTWKETRDILRAVRGKDFRIVHAHGVKGNDDTIILSGSEYSTLQNAHPRFGEVLKWLLKTKTFLFIGVGLEDPDLIFQLQEAVAEHGDAAGLHYALLPYDEAPEMRCRILRELNIEVIPVGSEEEAKEAKKNNKEWRTPATALILRNLGGKVARQRLNLALPGFPTSDDPFFCLDASLRTLLDQAISLTGSYRGDFCLSPDGLGSHLSGQLFYSLWAGPTSEDVRSKTVEANSICGIAYYQATPEFGVYVKNVDTKEISKNSRLGHYGVIDYLKADKNVRSELALPIEADGVRVGVLNLESNLIDAYSDDHLKVARRFAEKAGRLYAAAHDRQYRGKRLGAKRVEPAYNAMRRICERLWRIARGGKARELELAFLIYQADYKEGKLVAQNPRGTILSASAKDDIPIPTFEFHDPSKKNRFLATRVFLDGRPYAYPSVETAIRQGKVTDKYQVDLGLKGPVIGFPVLINGHIAGVVVAWHRNKKLLELDGRDIELFRRASHLMANSFRFRNDITLSGDSPSPTPEAPAENQKDDLISVRRVEDVLSCIESPKTKGPTGDDSVLNEIGKSFRDAIGGAMVAFLTILNQQETEFVEKMRRLQPSHPRPDHWISPRRSRCWIRARTSGNGKPRLVLALQVAMDGSDDLYKNVFRQGHKDYGIAMQPFMQPAASDTSKSADARRDRKNTPGGSKEIDTVQVKGFKQGIESLVFDDNPHLSFLLSRITAYPFAFQQRPGLVGDDIMADILEKDRALPWLVTPLIVGSEQEWREEDPAVDDDSSPPVNAGSEKCLAAYLTFDSGRYVKDISVPGKSDTKVRIEITEEWASFQNDLLHQIALFGACMAQHESFRRLV